MSNPVIFQSTEHPVTPGARVIFRPHPGPQSYALLERSDEILVGGSKTGGKTMICQAFILKGNPHEDPRKHVANVSYILHPDYRALVLRKNFKDMSDWLDTASTFFENPLWPDKQRAKYNKDKQFYYWPSGARCYVDHLADGTAYQKYKGRGVLHRLVIEELTDSCPEEETFWLLTSCLRSHEATPELVCQTMCSTNPEGPGLEWVKARFMSDADGRTVPPNTRFEIKVISPISGREGSISRIFIPFKVSDNPTVDKQTEIRLAALPEHLRRVYLEGDWEGNFGTKFFPEFRKEQRAHEVQGAVHLVSEQEITFEPWESSIAAFDWGYVHKAVWLWATEKALGPLAGRFIIREESVIRRTSDVEMGRQFAERSMKYLTKEQPVLQLFVPPEIFSKYNASDRMESIVGRLVTGIEQVLGKDSTVLLESDLDFLGQVKWQRSLKVIIRKAHNQRVHGWGIIRQMLDWSRLGATVPKFDKAYALNLAGKDSLLYLEYMRRLQEVTKEANQPRMLIVKERCPELISGIQRAVFDKDGDVKKEDCDIQTGNGGDDAIDACRYLCVGAQSIRNKEPKEEWLARNLELHRMLYGEGTDAAKLQTLQWLDKTWEEKNRKNHKPLNLHRSRFLRN